MINYDNVCKILDELMVEILNKGFTVPQHVFDDLKSARNLINIYRSSPQELGQAMESSPFLQIAEMNLLTIAETEIGKDYADSWQRQIISAYLEECPSGVKPMAFVSGVPRGDHWIRLKTSDVDIDGELSALLASLGLFVKNQDDGYILIHGGKDDVKTFLKAVRRKTVEEGVK